MGSAISQSRGYWTITVFGDGTYMIENYKAIQNSKNAKDKNLMRYSIISVLPWNKTVVISAKVKDSKKVKPNSNYRNITHLNNENLKVTHSRAKASNAAHALHRHSQKQQVKPSSTTNTVSSVKKFPKTVSLMSPKRVVEHALTNELLTCLGEFLCRRCYRLTHLSPTDPVHWLRSVDKALLLQGWQDQGFICPASMVFLYMLCREVISSEVASENELQAVLLTCLYLSYSYIGNEISYPVKPFLVKKCKNGFWNCCLSIINLMSSKMLQLNYDDHFFTEVFADLKNENSQGETSQLSIALDR